ncbi:hypothetical protein P4E94_19260 [Pontiellaceae bacterium B12219]|nr:hypothetical protein [Pontiellaceae bacterium B12219]
MKLTLLVSQKSQSDWNLFREIYGAGQRGDIEPVKTAGVVFVGKEAILFDKTCAYSEFARVCGFLERKDWPYTVFEIDPSLVFSSGKREEELQTILSHCSD